MDNQCRNTQLLMQRMCNLEKRMPIFQVNGVANDIQNILNFITTTSVTFQYNGEGKIIAISSGGVSSDAIETVELKTDVVLSGPTRFIKVNLDASNNGDKSLYLYSQGVLEFLQTIIT